MDSDYPEGALAACLDAVGEEFRVWDGGRKISGRITQCEPDGVVTSRSPSGKVKRYVAFRVWLNADLCDPCVVGPFRVTALPVGDEE